MIKNGELRRRVTEEGLTGVTSNPAIFNAAISKSHDYDGQISELAGQSANSVYEALIVTDVRDACDILRPVYDRSAGRDGFVSLEVSPHLARDTQGSIAEARRFWQAVARPNLFSKIPGTPEGVPAIEELLVEGINITLLFSIERYEAVALAYLRALERRKREMASINRIGSQFLLEPNRHARRRTAAGKGQRRQPGRRTLARQVRNRQREARLSALQGDVFFDAVAFARTRRRKTSAALVGQHQHEEPVLRRSDVCRAADRRANDQHAAEQDHNCLRAPRKGDGFPGTRGR